MKIGILVYYEKAQLKDNGHYSESDISGVMPLYNLDFFCQICLF